MCPISRISAGEQLSIVVVVAAAADDNQFMGQEEEEVEHEGQTLIKDASEICQKIA